MCSIHIISKHIKISHKQSVLFYGPRVSKLFWPFFVFKTKMSLERKLSSSIQIGSFIFPSTEVSATKTSSSFEIFLIFTFSKTNWLAIITVRAFPSRFIWEYWAFWRIEDWIRKFIGFLSIVVQNSYFWSVFIIKNWPFSIFFWGYSL